MRRAGWSAVLCASVVAMVAQAGATAEIALRALARPAGNLVVLGDVADVLSNDADEAERLAAVELFPAPGPGKERFLRLVELEDILVLRGVALSDHTFSGASQVTVQPPALDASGPQSSTPSTAESVRAERIVREAIVRHLRQAAGTTATWQVDLKLSPDEVRIVSRPGVKLSAAGGESPWVGPQKFILTIEGLDSTRQLSISPKVALPPTVVVTTRSLPRGAVIAPDDVALIPAANGRPEAGLIEAIDQAVGLETKQALAAGQAIAAGDVQAPVIIRRGDVVDVTARSPGVRVRTKARARQEGSRGDLVEVESLADRKSFLARVSGVGQVEVDARAIPAADAP
jgi:flagella basal body P-ring formation protein FlgA